MHQFQVAIVAPDLADPAHCALFTLLTLIGSVPRCLFYAYMGELILEYNTQALIVIFAALVMVFVFYRFRRGENWKSESSQTGTSTRENEQLAEDLRVY